MFVFLFMLIRSSLKKQAEFKSKFSLWSVFADKSFKLCQVKTIVIFIFRPSFLPSFLSSSETVQHSITIEGLRKQGA